MLTQRAAARGLYGLAVVLVPRAALAHAGEPPAPHELWQAWSADPAVLLGISIAAALYGYGLSALWAKAGRGRGIRVLQAVAYAGGLLALVVALVSPLDALGSVLFSGHMAQHLVLMLIAAPLLVAGEPLPVFLWALPASWRRGVRRVVQRTSFKTAWRALTNAFTVWTLNVVVLWVWHLPAMFQASLTSETVHTLQHVSFLAVSLLFWWCVLDLARVGQRHGAAILYVFTTMMHGMALGVIIATSRVVLYPAYAERVRPWSITALEDQQIAGLIMWMPPGMVYVAAVVVLLVSWLRVAEQRAQRRERQEYASVESRGASDAVRRIVVG